MKKKILTMLASTALLAGLFTTGSVATAEPAAAHSFPNVKLQLCDTDPVNHWPFYYGHYLRSTGSGKNHKHHWVFWNVMGQAHYHSTTCDHRVGPH